MLLAFLFLILQGKFCFARVASHVTFEIITAKNRKEVLVVRTSYRKEVLAPLSCSRKEVLAVSRTQAQATCNQPQEELLLADAKRSSCACIIFGLYCTPAKCTFSTMAQTVFVLSNWRKLPLLSIVSNVWQFLLKNRMTHPWVAEN